MAVGAWGIQPSDFWAMTPEEWWRLYEFKRPKDPKEKLAGDLTPADCDELLAMMDRAG